jgi:hypothetical protein
VADLGITLLPELTLETCEAIYDFRPERLADRISPRPLLVVHGTRDELYAPEEAQSIYDHAHAPKDLIWIEGGNHLEWINAENPLSKPAIGQVVTWFEAKLPPRGASSTEFRVPSRMFGR